ncbi:c-type cytochrome biogenesis protein CcsB [Zhihengliuella flava]|uniref:Cytochrome c-type biogenesis protein CcsB n=1 Tax=Zhihengliuella flava TaxID=1285193 RepID=A0A931D495_9MICC|nr:c-type cytochrome biogenesis protein CcsB [Zhihengliuella flava]MBG6084134.1 cytochrome c-type biogenesis protein CcsB [Zhihengliuella flava]
MPVINEELGAFSDMFMLLAAFAYAVALIAFAWDMAKSNATIRALESEVLANERAEVKQLASVGGRGEDAHSGPDDSAPTQLVDDSMEYAAGTDKRPIARIAVVLTWLAAVVHTAAVLTRAFAAGRVPWGNMYEFLTTGALLVALVYLLVLLKKDLRFMGVFVTLLVTVMLCAATIGFPTPVGHLVPALQSYWLIIHVSIAVLASSLFTITFVANVLQLLQHRRMTKLKETGRDVMPWLRLVPSAGALENLAYRINAVSFVMWTFTVMAGAIWAEQAWGRYWGWDPKEVWSFVIWVVYAGYLHARATRGWTGVRSAWLSIVGYACLIFNFTVVNIYFDGLHSYAGV